MIAYHDGIEHGAVWGAVLLVLLVAVLVAGALRERRLEREAAPSDGERGA